MNNSQHKSTQFRNHFVLLLLVILFLSACTQNKLSPTKTPESLGEIPYTHVCRQAHNYQGKVVGDGHCVSLIKACSEAPATKLWRPSTFVSESGRGSIEPGTVIATFRNGRYPNKTGWHAAIYISHGPEGIWVWDQWIGKPVHKRLIRYRNDKATPANSAQSYRIVTTPPLID